MKNQNIARILALVLAIVMMLSIVACNKPAEENTTPAETTPAATTPAETTTEAPAETTTEAPVETTTEAPAETTTEAPAETTTEAPAETTTEAPAETTTEAPAETTTEAPAETTTEAPEETTTEAPVVPDEPHVHEIVDGMCECGYIPVFENASVYDNDGDGNVDTYFFTPILPEKFQGEDAIHVWAGTNESPAGSFNTATFSDITHWYCIETKGHYLLYTVEVPVAGVYEMAVHMRMKDSKERGAKYTVNEGTDNEYVFETSFQFATDEDAFAARENDYTMSSYMFGIELELVAGKNTIKIQDSSKCPKNQHFRDFYFVLIEEAHVHEIVDGMCECGYIPVFENASVYDNDGDGNVDTYFFTPILPEKFQGEDAIHVWAGTNESPAGSFNTATFSDITHWYCIETKGHYLLYTVEVPVAGVYEMAVHMRMKDSKERGAKYTVNEGTDNEYVFETSFQFATDEDAFAARENDYTMSSYMFGIELELVAGKNTIKIQDSSKCPKNQHFRDFYFVKVADWTPACAEHSIVDGICETCGFIPVYEMPSVYDNDGDEKLDTFFFTPILPEKFTAEGVTHVWAGTLETPQGSYSSAAFSDIRHWYCTEGQGQYLLYTVEVAESGIYELAVHMRMKDSKERGAKYIINEGTANEYVIETSFQFATDEDAYAARENDYTMSSYMYGIQVKLVAGKNTLKITDSSKSPKNQHFRDFYFVKVADWTPAEDVVEPQGPATLTVQEAIDLGMTFEKGAYSSEYYYVTLTLDHQVNANGFARMTVAEGLYITVAGGYLTGEAEGSIAVGDTVTFLAKVGAANSALTTGGKELRLYEVQSWEIVPAN